MHVSNKQWLVKYNNNNDYRNENDDISANRYC